jgi:hypothetical protein
VSASTLRTSFLLRVRFPQTLEVGKEQPQKFSVNRIRHWSLSWQMIGKCTHATAVGHHPWRRSDADRSALPAAARGSATLDEDTGAVVLLGPWLRAVIWQIHLAAAAPRSAKLSSGNVTYR